MATHHPGPGAGTCHWGTFDATIPPVLRVASGDTVTIDTVSGGPEVVPDRARFHVPPALDAVHAELKPFGPHISLPAALVPTARPRPRPRPCTASSPATSMSSTRTDGRPVARPGAPSQALPC